MCVNCSGRPTTVSCETIRADGDDRALPWVARVVARPADGGPDVVLASTTSLLGHSYMARATWLPVGYRSLPIEHGDEPNYDLAIPSNAMQAEMASLDFDVGALMSSLIAGVDGHALHLEVAGSPIDAPAPRQPRRLRPDLPGWLDHAAFERMRQQPTPTTTWSEAMMA